MPSLARIAQKIFMTTVIAANPCKAAMQIAALQIAVNHIHHIGVPKTTAGCEAVIPYVLEFFKVDPQQDRFEDLKGAGMALGVDAEGGYIASVRADLTEGQVTRYK